jgi:hypothetical protein
MIDRAGVLNARGPRHWRTLGRRTAARQ